MSMTAQEKLKNIRSKNRFVEYLQNELIPGCEVKPFVSNKLHYMAKVTNINEQIQLQQLNNNKFNAKFELRKDPDNNQAVYVLLPKQKKIHAGDIADTISYLLNIFIICTIMMFMFDYGLLNDIYYHPYMIKAYDSFIESLNDYFK
jgi:hypothetical protein